MKKIILLFFVTFSIINVKGQEFTSFSMGLNNVRINTLDESHLGFVMGFDYNKLHVDFSSNYTKDEGKYFVFPYNYITQENKQMWYIINVGVNFPIKQINTNSLMLTPKLGYCSIYSLSLFDSYYKEYYEKKYNMGIHLSHLNKNAMFSIGTSIIEKFYLSIGVLF